MNESRNFPDSIVIRSVIFSEVGIGVTANIILLLLHIHKLFLQCRPKPTDFIISHMALVHIVMLIIMAIMVVNIFDFSSFWNDFSCKSIIFLNRLMRGMSHCTTCLLSILQAITLSPRSSCLAKFKHTSSQCILCCLSSLWAFNMSINVRFLVFVVAKNNVTSAHLLFVTESCSVWPQNCFLRQLFFTLTIFQDVAFIALMAFSSGYMVILLYKHKSQTQHLHSSNLASKALPEERATQTILMLMTSFVVIYFMECIFISSITVWYNDSVRLYIQVLLSNSYATISPLLLIRSEKLIIKFRKTQFA